MIKICTNHEYKSCTIWYKSGTIRYKMGTMEYKSWIQTQRCQSTNYLHNIALFHSHYLKNLIMAQFISPALGFKPNSHWWFLAEKSARNHGGGWKPRSPRIVWFLGDFSPRNHMRSAASPISHMIWEIIACYDFSDHMRNRRDIGEKSPVWIRTDLLYDAVWFLSRSDQ